MKHFNTSKIMFFKMIGVPLIIVLMGVYILFTINPPFRIIAHDYGEYQPVVVAIESKGSMNIVLQKVLINGVELPLDARVATRPSSGPVDWWNINEIAFVEVKGAVIKPNLSYGIPIVHYNFIESITIKYIYMGIPLRYTISSEHFIVSSPWGR